MIKWHISRRIAIILIVIGLLGTIGCILAMTNSASNVGITGQTDSVVTQTPAVDSDTYASSLASEEESASLTTLRSVLPITCIVVMILGAVAWIAARAGG